MGRYLGMVRRRREEMDIIEEELINRNNIEEDKSKREKRKRKIKVGFFLDEELVKEFKRFCIMKYGVYEYGMYSEEVELALRHWISLGKHGKVGNPSNKVQGNKPILVFQQVLNYIKQKYGLDIGYSTELAKRFFIEGIKAVRGSSDKTVKKWLNIFKELGFIKESESNIYVVNIGV